MATSRNRRRLLAAAVAGSTAVAGLALAAPASAAGAPAPHVQIPAHRQFTKPTSLPADAAARVAAEVPQSGRYGFLLKLKPASTVARFNAVRRSDSLAAAKAAATSQLSTVQAAQNTVVDHFGSLAGKTSVLYRTHAVMSGVAVTTNVSNIPALYALPGVTAVYPISPKAPDNSYAVPFQNGPAAWEGDGSGADLGQGVRVADIDTGLDYTHADFGGPGTPAAYLAAHDADTVAPLPSSYDPNKFDAADSYDLAGDDYQADPNTAGYQPVPHPDPNPLDCSPQYGGEGHGSHTAGTIAGYGVTADGQTYDGPYDSSTDFSSMQIGPGMAPKATLISYRVFGCTGSTNLVSDAIDRAMDPDGDPATNDHVDVINMSLGSDYGSPDDADAEMADAAADLGITLSISMGNSYDVYDVGGSPGAATKAITVAASADAQEVDDTVNLNITGGSDGTLDGDFKVAGTRATMYAWGQDGEQYGAGDMPDTADLVAVPSDDATACAPLPAGSLTGKIAVVTQWNDSAPECGSIARGANLRAAGAVGFLFLSDRDSVSAGINGDQGADGKQDDGTTSTDAIPGVLVVRGDTGSGTPTDSALIRAALAAGATITVSSTSAATAVHNDTSLNDTMTDFSSRGLRGEGNLKPDVAAVGATVFSVLPGSGVEGQSMSGTSMAAPMVAGLAALVKSEHTGWTPAQIKSDIMNTASHDLTTGAGHTGIDYAPMRVGSGRIDAGQAIHNPVLASVTDDPGAVSASFGPVQVTASGTLTRTKTIQLQNTGGTDETYAASVDDATTVPGVSYSVSPTRVTVPANSTTTVTLTLTVDPSHWDKTFDQAKAGYDAASGLDLDPASGLPEQTIAEASGDAIFKPADSALPSLRVPYYSAPRLASTMSQPSSVVLGADGTGTLALTGTGVDTTNVFSLAQGFELTATSPTAPPCTDAELGSTDGPVGCLTNNADKGSDIRYVGIGTDPGEVDGTVSNDNAGQDENGDPVATPTLDFAIATYGQHTTPADKDQFVIYEDVDGDGKADYYTVNTHYDSSDFVVSATFSTTQKDSTGADLNVDVEILNSFLGEVDTAAYDSDVLVVPVATAVFGDASTIHYGIEAVGVQGTIVDSVGLGANDSPQLVADLAQPGLTVAQDGDPQALDESSADPLTVKRNDASYAEEGGQGILMVHFHNAPGNQAQVVGFGSATPPPAPTVSLSANPTSVTKGGSTTLTATVGNPTSGDVTFVDGSGATLGTAPVTDGKATYTLTPSATVTVTAKYQDVSSNPVTITVTKAKAAVSLTAPDKVKAGATYTVRVGVAAVGKTPATGQVTLTAGTTHLSARLVAGVATFSLKAPARGTVALRAAYAGDDNYQAGSATGRVSVVAAPSKPHKPAKHHKPVKHKKPAKHHQPKRHHHR